MSDQTSKRTRFSSGDLFSHLPPQQAAKAWQEFFIEHFSGIEIDVRDDVPFQGVIDGILLGEDVSVSRVGINARRAARTQKIVNSDQKNMYALVVNTTGARRFISQSGRDLYLEPGAATLYSYDVPGELFDLSASPYLPIQINRSLLSSRVDRADDLLLQ